MLKKMGKVMAMLLVGGVMLAGCNLPNMGNGASTTNSNGLLTTPTESVQAFYRYVVDGDATAIEKTTAKTMEELGYSREKITEVIVNSYNQLGFSATDVDKLIIKLEAMAKNVTYKVLNEVVSGERATVEVGVKAIDLATINSVGMHQELNEKLLNGSFGEVGEEQRTKMIDFIIAKLGEAKISATEEKITIGVQKINEVWLVHPENISIIAKSLFII